MHQYSAVALKLMLFLCIKDIVMKAIIKYLVLSSAVLCLAGCGSAYYGSTRYKNDDISLGDSKGRVVQKYGKPYSQEIETIDGKTVETIGYKERMRYGYRINTFFVFEDGKLIRKVQQEQRPHPSITVDEE